MKSARLVDINRIEIIEIPEPNPGPDQVMVALRSVGICGSDTHYFNIGRIGKDRCAFPQPLGHECAGEICSAPEGSGLKPGMRVAIEPALPCMKCEQCRTAHYNCCPNVKFLGSPGMPGALSEFIAVHTSQVVQIPDSMDFDTAAMLEPLGVAFHSIRLSGLTPGQSVAIFGAGAVGLLTLAMAKACGAGETFIADKLQYRLDFASRTYGADHCIHVTTTDPLQYIHTATSGRGVDYTFEAAGQPDTFQWSFESARIGGKALIIGIPEVDSISFNPHTMRRKELVIQNVRRSNMALESCIDLVERGIVSVGGLATHHYSLEHTAEAFATVAGYEDNVIRAVVVPGRDKR